MPKSTTRKPKAKQKSRQLQLDFPPDVTPPIGGLSRRRPRPDADPRWFYSWQAPSEAEFVRLIAEEAQVAK